MAKVFLVGGAVRDLVLGLEPKDFDFVVVGSSPKEMLSHGFEQVGNTFPVFLHPVTGDEFALARRERKVGNGHTGFECDWEGVTLYEDLERRDLTINAMAIYRGDNLQGFIDSDAEVCRDVTPSGVKISDIIDPFGGLEHIKDKMLEGVSIHFREDPLRVLRVARFLARLGNEWSVSPAFFDECRYMVSHGELDELTPERVWKEMSRALMEDAPSSFFCFLCELGWSGVKELSDLRNALQRPDFHPEGDSLVHTLECIDRAADMGLNLENRFAVLCHDFGKWPAFQHNRAMGKNHLGGHEAMGVPLIRDFCERHKVPNSCAKWAEVVARDHTNVHNLHKLRPSTVNKMFKRWNLKGKPHLAMWMVQCTTADARGRTEEHMYDVHPNGNLLLGLAQAWLQKVDVDQLQANHRGQLKGHLIGAAVERKQIANVAEAKAELLEIMERNPR